MDWYLEVVDSPRLPAGIKFKLSPGAPSYTFGREKSANEHHIRIPEVNVSRSHAIMFCRGEQPEFSPPFICDMGSVIGTFVNDTRISEERIKSQPYQLYHKDKVSIGQTQFRVVRYNTREADDDDDDHEGIELDENLSDPMDGFSDAEESSCSSYSSKVKKFAALTRMKDCAENVVTASQSSSNPIPEANIGFKMLKKLGWQRGKGLGKDQQGLLAPIDPGLDSPDLRSRPSFLR
ncbi:Angiogenic factor with G patch and FHA domains 1 [Mitosporidium daphniae]